MASTPYTRLFLRSLKWEAEELGTTLGDTLKVAARAKIADTTTGRALVSTAHGGASVTYQIPPGLDALTPTALAEMLSTLLDSYDRAKAAAPGATDDEIFAALMAGLRPIRSFRPDFRYLSRT